MRIMSAELPVVIIITMMIVIIIVILIEIVILIIIIIIVMIIVDILACLRLRCKRGECLELRRAAVTGVAALGRGGGGKGRSGGTCGAVAVGAGGGRRDVVCRDSSKNGKQYLVGHGGM